MSHEARVTGPRGTSLDLRAVFRYWPEILFIGLIVADKLGWLSYG